MSPEQGEALSPLEPAHMPLEAAARLACSGSVCLAQEVLQDDMDQDEEAVFEALQTAGDNWVAAIDRGKLQVQGFLAASEHVGNGLAQAQGLRRETRREQLSGPLSHVNQMAHMRDDERRHVLRLIRDEAAGSMSADERIVRADLPTLLTMRATLEEHAASVRTAACHVVQFYGTEYSTAAPYEPTFLADLISRTYLAEGALTQPDFMRMVFDPAVIGNLPRSMQLLAAADIARGGSQSILLQLFRDAPAPSADQETSAETIERYLADNGHSKQVRQVLGAMSSMAAALEAPYCLANGYGLCLQAFGRIPYDKLPDAVREDLRRRHDRRIEDQLAGLQAFADRQEVQISRWWRLNERIEYLNPLAADGGRRREQGRGSGRGKRDRGGQQVATRRALDESLQREAEQPETVPQTVRVSWKGGDGYVATTRPDAAEDAASLHEAGGVLSDIMMSKEFLEYVDEYRADAGLPYMLVEALTAILYSRDYRQGDVLRPMTYRRPIVDEEGRRLPVWRFSGRTFKSSASSVVGRDTRIYFGMSGTAGERVVRIIGVRHKTAVAKAVGRNKNI